MMAKALFFLLLALSVGFLLNSLRRREGVFEFPALFAGAFAFSIAPQLVNHVFYPGRLPARVYQDHGVEYGLLMCVLCLVAGIAGYRGTSRVALGAEKSVRRIDVERLFWAGAVLSAVGISGAARLASLAGGWTAQFIEGGHYGLEWSGAPVLWAYVVKLVPLGLLLCLNSVLVRGSVWKWVVLLLTVLYPLAIIVFMGRRSMVFRLAMIVVISLWFQRRWAPPRWISLGGMAVGGMLIILLPYYRTYANRTGDIKGAMAQVDTKSAVEAYAVGDRAEGMDNLIIGIRARLVTPSFFWGTGFWNAAVDCLVPGQIVGYRLKQSLMVAIGASDDEVFSRYCGLEPEYGSFSTGPYTAFSEFWFLGCLLYFAIGRFYRWLWYWADRRRDVSAQMIYASCAMLIPMAAVNSVEGAFAMFLLLVGVLVPVLGLIRDRVPGLTCASRVLGSRTHQLSPATPLKRYAPASNNTN